jgi:hypothetical protein
MKHWSFQVKSVRKDGNNNDIQIKVVIEAFGESVEEKRKFI